MIESLVLSDFGLGRVLGAGTVGTIYLARVRDDRDVSAAAALLRGRDLAIKKLHPGISEDPVIGARFEREMVVLARLQHPNIVTYFGGGSDRRDGTLFYVMERVDGGTIKDLLARRGRLAWPAVVDIARQTASALQCAHNHGVVHRDLKPGNLFLTKSGMVKLGDFGIACDLQQGGQLTAQGLTVGTHAYMAPEQITASGPVTGQADLYSLGCCLYEMLTGQKVFAAENFAQLFHQHLHEDPPRVERHAPDCPASLSDVVASCLAKDPRQRPFNARWVQGKMGEIGINEGLQAKSTSDPGSSSDVGAASVTAAGRELLRQQIADPSVAGQTREVNAGRLAVILVLLAVLIASAAMLS